jgi:hypothetical protein
MSGDKQRNSSSSLKVRDVEEKQQMVVENWLAEIILHISLRNELFGFPVMLCFETIHAVLGLLCYFFKVEYKLHESEGGQKCFITKKGETKEVGSKYGTQWTKKFISGVLGCPDSQVTLPPVKQCHNQDCSEGLLFLLKIMRHHEIHRC